MWVKVKEVMMRQTSENEPRLLTVEYMQKVACRIKNVLGQKTSLQAHRLQKINIAFMDDCGSKDGILLLIKVVSRI